ncbi:TIGR03769 domain-containing protein [Streptomyces sp. NPDC004629]|uniref:TIGR03769 domain-containing protein n=1 Tax=Streptomyces sp. NPDC004629 TaxID=3364705 RepID=UPI00369EE5D0
MGRHRPAPARPRRGERHRVRAGRRDAVRAGRRQSRQPGLRTATDDFSVYEGAGTRWYDSNTVTTGFKSKTFGVGTHNHANWAFEEAGTYQLTFRVRGRRRHRVRHRDVHRRRQLVMGALTRGRRAFTAAALTAATAVLLGAAGLVVAGGSGAARAAVGAVVLDEGELDFVPRLVDRTAGRTNA